MRTKDGRHGAPLHPTHMKLRVVARAADDVVRPEACTTRGSRARQRARPHQPQPRPTVANVAGGAGEVRLERKRAPAVHHVAREAALVAVVAHTAPSGQRETPAPAAAPTIVRASEVIQPYGRVQAARAHARAATLAVRDARGSAVRVGRAARGAGQCRPRTCCQSIHQKSMPMPSSGFSTMSSRLYA